MTSVNEADPSLRRTIDTFQTRCHELRPLDRHTPQMPGGRDQREPMERLVRLASVLSHAGRVGVPAATLIEVADFDGDKDLGSQLHRELKYLRDQGWEITNVAAKGEPGATG